MGGEEEAEVVAWAVDGGAGWSGEGVVVGDWGNLRGFLRRG